MTTECSATLFEFSPLEGSKVVASFDGGVITTDAGALPWARDRASWLTDAFRNDPVLAVLPASWLRNDRTKPPLAG